MAVSAEHRALHHAIDDLRSATTSLRGAHGDVPAVVRLRNDLERLILDVADVDALPAAAVPNRMTTSAPSWTPVAGTPLTGRAPDEPPGREAEHGYVAYTPSSWDDVDDEGVGGFRGPPVKPRR